MAHGLGCLAAAAWMACGGAGSDRGEEQVAELAADSLLTEEASAGAAAEPVAGLPDSLPAAGTVETELRTYPLRIVNRFSTEIMVWASAGAQRVVLDTLAAHDSVRVDIQVRAQRVLMEVTDASGRPLLQHDLSLLADTVTRWVAEPARGEARTGRL